MRILHHPHPTLRHQSKPVKRVDAHLRGLIGQMFDLMYEAHGIGLAGNQVGLPLRLFVMNLAGKRGEGEEFVFINPTINLPTGSDEAEEGCLSLPGVYGPVLRPAEVHFSAYTLAGDKFEQKVNGLFARCVQHEKDHLDGIMFIDRLDEDSLVEVQDKIDEFAARFERARSDGEIGSDEHIANERSAMERLYC